jgi:hypothetical protein
VIIIGWKTHDYRGPRTWAALWAHEDTEGNVEAALRHNAKQGHEPSIVRTFPDFMSLADAKRRVRDELNRSK